MKKDEVVMISNSEMKFIKDNQSSNCPVVQAVIDKIAGTGPEIDILPAGFSQSNPIQDLNDVTSNQINKNFKKIFKDKEGNLLKPVDKVISFGHVFIIFKYENQNYFRALRRDKVLNILSIINLEKKDLT